MKPTDIIRTQCDLIDAQPVSTQWPVSVNCLGGTPAPAIYIPVGDTDSGGFPEPYYTRLMENTADGSILFFGDSIFQALPECLATPYGVNFGIGGQSLRRLINRLHDTEAASRAGACVILSGVNDLGNTTYYGPRSNGDAVTTVLGMYSAKINPWITGKWVICHLLPCNEVVTGAIGYNAQVSAVNSGLTSAMTGTAAQIAFVPVNPEFVDSDGNLKTEYHCGDGQHLSRSGAALLASGIRDALQSLGL